MTEKEKEREELLKILLKNILEERLSRLEKRNIQQANDIKFEKEAYRKQELLVNKLCSIKIEPKKPQNKSNNERGKRIRDRGRDVTPNNIRAFNKRNNSIKRPERKIRNMTPDIKIRKRLGEKKDNTKTEIRGTKKNVKNNNNIPSYMMGTNSNANKNRRNRYDNNEKSRLSKKAKTPDIGRRNKPNERKTKKVNNDIENNLKLIDLKIDDMKEHVPIEEKKEEKKEEIKIEKKPAKEPFNFDNFIQEKIIKTFIQFLDTETRYNFLSCNKKLIKYIQDKLSDSLMTLEIKNNISEASTVQDQINSLKLKYQSDQFNIDPPKFALSRGTVKAIELLNNEDYSRIFHDKELIPPLDNIIYVYKIFFQFLKDNDLKNIKDEKKFWIQASDYILNQSNGKIGDFFRDSVENFDFSVKNIYEAKKIIFGKEDQLKPANFTKICATTGLIIFLIKDTLEFCGVILSLKKNVPTLCLQYLEYVGNLQEKLRNYIDKIREWNDYA